MSTDDCLALAKEIYVMKVAFSSSWDRQQIARDCLDAAQQFSLAVSAASTPQAQQQDDQTQTQVQDQSQPDQSDQSQDQSQPDQPAAPADQLATEAAPAAASTT